MCSFLTQERQDRQTIDDIRRSTSQNCDVKEASSCGLFNDAVSISDYTARVTTMLITSLMRLAHITGAARSR
jgi:hypothetical protein